MTDLTIPVQPRTEDGRGASYRLRTQGLIPGIIYGKHRTPTMIAVAEKEFIRLKRNLAGEARVVTVQENGDSCQAVIQELQRHPITDKFLHVDFMQITDDRKIRVKVPVEPVGDPVGVRTEKGVLNKMVRTLEVECLPKDLPGKIEVDVSELKKGEGIQISKIKAPEGCILRGRADVVVFMITK